MEKFEKKGINDLASTLYQNNITISNYDYDNAMLVLRKINASDEQVNLFEKESFHVFLEIMRLETINSMHNVFKPI
jgi:hypothetical protein